MSRRLLLLAAFLSAPAAAQHHHHPAPEPEAAPPAEDPHAGHEMAAPDAPAADPHAGHQMEAPATPPAADPHTGHHTPPAQPQADPHAGHAMPHGAAPEGPPVAPPPAAAFTGPEHAAETVFDPALFRRKRQEALIDEHGGHVGWMLLADRLEYRFSDGRDGYAWEGEAWYGGDYDKLWLKSEGEGGFGEAPEQAEVQLLYSRAISPWFDLQGGIRHDFRPDPERTHLALGVQGLAPYWFEVEAMLFLSDRGDATARLEAEYDQRITNRLILQPALETEWAAQDVPELGIGAGLSAIEAGLRLRYEIVPEFAPYVGVEYERAIGDTARFARAAGDDAGGWSLLIGLRSWF